MPDDRPYYFDPNEKREKPPAAETADSHTHVPPQDLYAEQGVLGAMLLEPEAVERAFCIVTADDFYREAHRHICRAMQDLLGRGQPIDLITVSAELRAKPIPDSRRAFC